MKNSYIICFIYIQTTDCPLWKFHATCARARALDDQLTEIEALSKIKILLLVYIININSRFISFP